MPDGPDPVIATVMFTDVVNSTGVIQRVGDEQGQRIFEAHHEVMRELLSTHGGEELQWLGDGLMAAFASTAKTVRCAIAMQRATLEPVSGHLLEIRVGLNVGEVLRQDTGSGYFGTPVVVAARLCESAQAGQILASSLVSGLLAGRQAFRFRALGPAELKGIDEPVGVAELIYDRERNLPLLSKALFVGRSEELGRLALALKRTRAGSGGVVLLAGEPGIGKTRTLEEFAGRARRAGARALWGSCYEGEGARPFAPFSEALEDYVGSADPAELREDLGRHGAALEALAPSLRERVGDLPDLPRLDPDEERTRLFDALTQLLLATARRAPVLLVLDDLHWADRGTIALLRYVARFVAKGRLLLVGAYRDVELDRRHPLADALAGLKREVDYERIPMKGLVAAEVAELLAAVSEQAPPPPFSDALSANTQGNPFFIREFLLHLAEEGKLQLAGGRWPSQLGLEELGIPEGVRQLIGRRLSRLSEAANRLLAVASGFHGAFHLPVASGAARLEEQFALDALDEALESHLVRPGSGTDVYEFAHALIRHTLYAEMNPSRRVRLHRRIAEAMQSVYGEGAVDRAGEIARQYHRSAALPGAERGVPHCLAAADRAERAAAHEEVASLLRMGLDLLPENDSGRPRILGRLGLALARSLAVEDAAETASQAGELIARSEGGDAAADYLADAAAAVWLAGFSPIAWRLAEQGLRHIGDRRDLTWARLAELDLARREAADPDFPGIPLDSPIRRELSRMLSKDAKAGEGRRQEEWIQSIFWSREHVQLLDQHPWGEYIAFYVGDYRKGVSVIRAEGEAAPERGQFGLAALCFTDLARVQLALGDLASCAESFARATDLASRLKDSPFLSLQLSAVPAELALVRGEGFEPLLPAGEALLEGIAPENRWVVAAVRATLALAYAHAERAEDALRLLQGTLPAIERAPGWATNYTLLVQCVVESLWTLGRSHHAEMIERNLREKIVAPDFRHPHTDSRLSLARLCALQERFDEASEWFAKARGVLDEQGARPLRAIVDYDEALMRVRRGAPGDRERASSLVDAALAAFREIDMPGWVRRAEARHREEQVHVASKHIRPVLRQRGQVALHETRARHRVVVQEQHPLAARLAHGAVARVGQAELGLDHEAERDREAQQASPGVGPDSLTRS